MGSEIRRMFLGKASGWGWLWQWQELFLAQLILK